MSIAGARLFAQYAYPPNELGYCGPAGAPDVPAGGATADVEQWARQFEGAWSYLELLAEVAGLDDPLDESVVAAYWRGSDLLDRTDPHRVLARLEARFRGQLGGTWRQADRRAAAHHSFQVFEVYPWAAMLAAGRPAGPALDVLEHCRVRVGRVTRVARQTVAVSTRPLVWQDGFLAESADVSQDLRWSGNGRTLVEPPAVGDLVALHWDWVCEVITPEQANEIVDREARTRGLVGLSDPVPAGAVT